MILINKIFILLLLLYAQNVGAERINEGFKRTSYTNNFLDIQVNYDKKLSNKKIQDTLDLIKKATLSPYILNNLESLSVEVNINKKSSKVSISNANKKCKITLNYDIDLKGVLINPYQEDLLFTYFHEISHCFLGKEIFRTGLKWNNSLNLSEEYIKKKDDQIEELTQQATIKEQCISKCIATNTFNKPPPLVVYHEMFADTMAIFLYQQYDYINVKNVFKKIEIVRFDNYIRNELKNIHQSFRVFNYIDARELCNKPIDFKEISFYTQRGFLNYLNDLE